MGVIAEFERSMVREQVDAGIARAKDAGIRAAGRRSRSTVEDVTFKRGQQRLAIIDQPLKG